MLKSIRDSGPRRGPQTLPQIQKLAEANYDLASGQKGAGQAISARVQAGTVAKLAALTEATTRILAGDQSDLFPPATKPVGEYAKLAAAGLDPALLHDPPQAPARRSATETGTAPRSELETYEQMFSVPGKSRQAGQYYHEHRQAITEQLAARNRRRKP